MNTAFKERRARIGVLTVVLAGLFVLLVLRLAALIELDGPRLDALARSEHTASLKLAALRGPIVDRNGAALALSAESRSVYARPPQLLAASTPAERAALAAALHLSRADLAARLSRRAPFVWLARRIAPARARAALALGLAGVGAVSEYKRFYPESNLAASVVGLAGMDGQGLSGLELQYNNLIGGAPVELHFYHDAFGHPILDSPLALKHPAPGARLVLTIDSRIQALAENDLRAEVLKSGARGGSAIVLDPFSGEVLALANVRQGLDPVHRRLHDAAVQDSYEPGSTMKGLLGSIALEDGVLNTADRIYCEEGQFRIGGHTIHDDTRNGWLDLGGIIEVSSNIGAAKIALKLGAARFYRGLRAFGLGQRTGIDLPGEASGLVRPPSTWRPIDLANHGFGQGIAVTPLQLAVAYAAIANGGLLMRPYVVKAAYDAAGNPILEHQPEVMRRAIAPGIAHTMNTLLRGVVNGPGGTAHLARVSDFIVAGKTGTAQMVDHQSGRYFQGRFVSSFVGFVPANNPRLLILVVLYNVGHGDFGGTVAAPVFSQIAAGALRDLNVAPPTSALDVASLIPAALTGGATPDAAARELKLASDAPAAAGIVPDFAGLSLRSALKLARARGLDLEVNGAGYVAAQTPAAGAPIVAPVVTLKLAPVLAMASRDVSGLRSSRADAPYSPAHARSRGARWGEGRIRARRARLQGIAHARRREAGR